MNKGTPIPPPFSHILSSRVASEPKVMVNNSENPITAVVRLKRRRDEDPLEVLVATVNEPSEKRLATEGLVFRFFGTVSSKVDLLKDRIEPPISSSLDNFNEKVKMYYVAKQEQRYQGAPIYDAEMHCNSSVINLDDADTETILDRFADIRAQMEEFEVPYVYDLYETNGADIAPLDKFKGQLVWHDEDDFEQLVISRGSDVESCRDLYDDPDSNSENYYANDYPEEESNICSENDETCSNSWKDEDNDCSSWDDSDIY